MIVWGILEGQLDSGIAAILGIDPTLGIVITANLGTKAKVDVLHSAVSISEELVGAGLCEKAHKTLNRIADISGRYRNTLAHGSAVKFQGGWYWQRISARTEIDAVMFNATARRWNKASSEVRKLTREWCRAYQDIWHALDSIPLKKRNATYGYRTRSN